MDGSKIKETFRSITKRTGNDSIFHLKDNKTNVLQEFSAGLTTFMAMSYILAVNPSLLEQVGMPKDQLFTATALASAFGTILMGLLANLPYGLAPGMGLNFFFVTLCTVQGYSWKYILFVLATEGVVFMVLSLLKIREKILGAIPEQLRMGISAGIGLFILYCGLDNAGFIVISGDSLSMGDITSVPVVLFFVGLIMVAVLYCLKVKGSLLIGILATWLLGIGAELIGWYQPADGSSLIPQAIVSLPAGINDIAFQCFDFGLFFGNTKSVISAILQFIVIFLTMFYSDFFDTMGTLIAVADKSKMTDENGKPRNAGQAFFSDATATFVGALLGTSTVTTYIESATGVMQGGRTGLTAIFTGMFFLLSLFFAPIFMAIPSFAVAPVMVFTGFLMLESFFRLKYDEYTESLPAVLTAVVMPFTSSIANGIAVGIISYTLLNAITGKIKKTNVLLWVLSVLFLAYFIFI